MIFEVYFLDQKHHILFFFFFIMIKFELGFIFRRVESFFKFNLFSQLVVFLSPTCSLLKNFVSFDNMF